MLNYGNIISRNVKNVYRINARSISFRSIIKFISIYYHRTRIGPKPPYDYICQVEDPVLRMKTTPVDTKIIQTKEFQKILDHLYEVMKRNGTVGLSAPQIGLPWQLFAMEVTEDSVNQIHSLIRKYYNIKSHPLTYFINPKLEIINPKEIICYESCGSIPCYEAEVPRATEIQIHALNQFGEPFTWNANGWLARIVQHEMDHLKGILYVDRMFPLTFDYCPTVNLNTTDGRTAVN